MTRDQLTPDHHGSATRGPSPAGAVLLRAVVNGMATVIRPHPDALLRLVIQRALDQTGNEGRPLSDWTATNDLGRPLTSSMNVGELGLEDGDTIFIQVEVGAGG